MEMSKKNAKFFFAAFAAFLLIASVVIIVPSASSNTTPNLSALRNTLNPTEITPTSNLYKYLHHVAYTQYPWSFGYNDSMTMSTPSPSALTDHLLWKSFLGSLDWYHDPVGLNHLDAVGIFNGTVIVGTTKTARPLVMFGLDQNTGQILWSNPGTIGPVFQIDGQRFCTGTSVYNIFTGQLLYTIARAPNLYIPELKMEITNGPSGGALGGATYMGWDWSDTTKAPVQLWTTNVTQIPAVENTQACYGNGNIYVFDSDMYIYAINAQTGQKVWSTLAEAVSCTCNQDNMCFAYNRLYFGTYYGDTTEHCYDPATGKLLWWAKLDGQQTRGQIVQDGAVLFQEMGSYFWALDAFDGHALWKHLTTRQMPLLQSQASAPADLGPENYGKTPMHV
jgi:outer membrane protein assembly factor BamB